TCATAISMTRTNGAFIMAMSKPENRESAIRSLIVAGVLLALAGVGGAVAALAFRKVSPPPVSKEQEDTQSSPTYHWNRPPPDLLPPPTPPTKSGERPPF